MSLLVLSSDDVFALSASLSPATLVSLMARVFLQLTTANDVAMPQRNCICTGTCDILTMPARIGGLGTGIKVVSVPKGQGQQGIPGTTLVLDEETGAVKAVVNARSLTALRTAAGSVLATLLLGPSEPKVLLLFGAGKQVEAHADLLIRTYPSLTSCIIVNRAKNVRLAKLVSTLQARYPHVSYTSEGAVDGVGLGAFDLQKAVATADIICTATSSMKPLFPSGWVKSGVHVNLIGSYTVDMMEVDSDLIQRAGMVLVDSKEACQIEAGELIMSGIGPQDMIEIGEIVDHTGGGIQEQINRIKRSGDISIFKSVGVGLQDVAIAYAIVERALARGIGIQIEKYDHY